METNYPSNICTSESVELIMLPTFSQNLTLQEAFEMAKQINKELKRTKFDGVFCKKIKL